MEPNSPPTHSNPPTFRRHLATLLQSAESFQRSFALNWSDTVEKLESFDNEIKSRFAEIEKREGLVDLRVVEVEKKDAELGCLEVSLVAKLRDVERREEECEKVFEELSAVEDCVDDRMRKTEAERLNFERRVKEEEERIEGMKRECEKKLEEFERLKLKEVGVEKERKEVELKELQCKKKLEEVERLKESLNQEFKLKEKEVEERQKVIELKKAHMEELERRNQSVSEELKLKESELEKVRKEAELRELQVKRRLEELIRLKQNVSEGAKKREKELDMREKEMVLKEMEFKKKLEELERSKLAASGALKLKEIQMVTEFNKKLEEIERSKQVASEALKLKETELEKRQKELELEDMELKKKLGEIEKLKQRALEALKVKEKELELEFNKKFEEHERSKLVDFEELGRKEKELKKQQKGLELKELELKKKSEELERLKLVGYEELKRKEKEFEEQKGVELKEMECKKLEEHERSKQISERSKQIISDAMDLKEKVEKQQKDVESEKLHYKNKLEELERDRERNWHDLKIKQNHVEKQRKDLELKEKSLDERFNELRGKEMEIKKRSEELHLREQQCESRSKENETDNKKTLALCKELNLENPKLTERLRMEEAKMDEQLKKIDWEKNQLLIRQDIADVDNQKFMRRLEELELKEKRLEERLREAELREKKADDTIYTQVKREPLDADNISADAGLCFNVRMDGKALQIFLNEREGDHEFMRNEVTAALSLSQNPAKLVLDAIQGFYPPHFRKGDIEFKEDVVRRSCILLLEQLRKTSPPINPHVKKEATELAFDWKRKMRADNEHSLEVLGFLQLLAAYNLASEFNSDDLLRCLETVALNSKAPELFRVLGFAACASSFIETLVRKKKRIEAIGFVFAFDLVNEFPPVPLLKDFLAFSRTGRRKLKDFDAKTEALHQRREDAKAALKCIQDHRLESQISPKQLQQQINDLGKQIAEMQKKMPAPGCRIRLTPPNVRTQSSTGVAAAVTSASEPKSAPFTGTKVDSTAPVRPSIKAQTGIKRPRCLIEDDFGVPSAEILPPEPIGASGNEVDPRVSPVKIEQPSGQFSKQLSSEHGISDSLHHENSKDHQLDLKTVECAFDAIKKFCSLEHENDKSASLGKSEERCILLLENLRNTPHHFDPHVKGEVLKFAADWKAQLMEKRSDHPNVVLFAEFLVAFGLTSSFPANDLILLLDSNSGRKTSSDLCQLLGLTDKIPDFIESLIQRNQRIEAAKYIHVLGMNDKFPIVRLLSDHWNYFKRTGQRLCEKYNHSVISQIAAIRGERDALAAIINCFEAFNIQSQGRMSPKILRERIVQLEKQKVLKEAELDKAKPFARLKSISLQQQKKSANNCGTEATANAGMKGPEIVHKRAIVSALVAGTSRLPDFVYTAAPNPVTITPSASSFSSIDKPALARTVNLPVDTVHPTFVACSSAPTISNTVTSNSLPSSDSTRELNIGSSPAAKAAVSPSSTSGPPSTAVPKTQPQLLAENKRRRVVVSSGLPLKPFHRNLS